ncbi:hypothetical protein CMI41_03845 [Candidatus Pacearchaeota archaeon]|nr:hypothetical protein [Candidatus Pacearchaeota archaeon]|tara:strand:+ start:299 stop:1147 length:849 start_codon:yes stop_codon:yes gene_type:complete
MRYFSAINGGVVAIIIFGVASFFIPGQGPSSDVETVLTVSTFLFAILAGFFISRLNSRYNQIRDLLVAEDADFLSFYKTASLFGKKFQKKVEELIEKYYLLVFDYFHEESYYKVTSKYFLQLYDELGKTKVKKGSLAENSYDDLLVTLENIEKSRNGASEIMGERLSKGYWAILFLLSGIIIFSVFFLKVPQLYSQLIATFLSSVVILVLLIMRDLENLKLGKNPVVAESGQEILEFLGKLRYYNERDIKSGYIIVPKSVKKYRVGFHKHGEKQDIRILTNK